MKKEKMAFVVLALMGSLLGLKLDVERDFEGNISLEGLTSSMARASTSEGRQLLNACQDQPGYYYYSCDASSTNYCTPTNCQGL